MDTNICTYVHRVYFALVTSDQALANLLVHLAATSVCLKSLSHNNVSHAACRGSAHNLTWHIMFVSGICCVA